MSLENVDANLKANPVLFQMIAWRRPKPGVRVVVQDPMFWIKLKTCPAPIGDPEETKPTYDEELMN